MSIIAEVEEKAMTLSKAERGHLASRLIASLGSPFDDDEDVIELALRRDKEMDEHPETVMSEEDSGHRSKNIAVSFRMMDIGFRRIVNVLGVFCFLGSVAFAQSGGKPEDKSPHESRFVSVGGVKLHYLDWGGTGEAVIFLPGAGDTAHVFDQLAPKFTDKFRVLGLTRRGFGESDKPEKGYDVDTLTNDVLGLVTHLKLKKVNLIGHSLAGNEMFHFAIKHPQRTLKLVFLDAGYGNRKLIYDTEPRPPAPERKPAEMPLEDKIDEEYAKYGDPYDPHFSKVKAPALSFYVMVEKTWPLPPGTDDSMRKRIEEWIESDVRPIQTRNIERFRKEVKNSEVIVLPNTTHYFFRDPKQFDNVVDTVRRFLLEPTK